MTVMCNNYVMVPPTGKVLEHVAGTHHYLVEWVNASSQETEIVHMFGQLSRKRGLRIGDHVIALADTSKQFNMLLIQPIDMYFMHDNVYTLYK